MSTSIKWPSTESSAGLTSVANFAALPPSGANGLYLTEDDNKVYYWTGIAWESILIQDASATAPGQVSLSAQTLGSGVKTITDGVATKQTQYTTGLAAPAYSEGLTFWDKDNKCLAQYNDVAAITQQNRARDFYQSLQ